MPGPLEEMWQATMRPARVEDADEVVLLLLDERRHRAPLHQELHVADRRGEAAADDLERDRIDAPRAAGVSSCRALQDDVVRAVDAGAEAGRDQRGGVVLLDDGRARRSVMPGAEARRARSTGVATKPDPRK